ncbi:hypothetical protein GXW82_35765 [Streptacidiphilus sp. 4-A2]|nr:hypothetical protein [Streptacidiphilus sp. 4-A2]
MKMRKALLPVAVSACLLMVAPTAMAEATPTAAATSTSTATAIATSAANAAATAAANAAATATATPKTEPNRGDSGVSFNAVLSYENIPAAHLAAFLAAAQRDGYESLKHEPGTLAFHVVPDPEDSTRIMVTETFLDRAAYELHQQGASERAFRAAAAKYGVSGPDYTIANTSMAPGAPTAGPPPRTATTAPSTPSWPRTRCRSRSARSSSSRSRPTPTDR